MTEIFQRHMPLPLVGRALTLPKLAFSQLALMSCAFFGAGLYPSSAQAQFDPSKVKQEPIAVSQRYPDPEVSYQTPGLAVKRSDFASHDEVLAYLKRLQAAHAQSKLEVVGQSQQGRDIPLLLLTSPGGFQREKPSVLVLGQQHGNEPAGGEAALALAEEILLKDPKLLNQVNVLVMPRANPDGAQNFVRATASGLDVNRDHLLLQTPEGQAIAEVARRFQPQVVMDLHEFTVGDRWIAKFAGYANYDALLQASTVGNMDRDIAERALRDYVGAARTALESHQLTTFWYHTASTDPQDKVVSMGGVQADTGRNVFGLRNAVSILIETRGVGLGRAHFARRVHSHVLASLAVIKSAASQGDSLVRAIEAAGQAAAAHACKGDLVVQAKATPTQESLQFVDAATGADRTVQVEWRSALALKPVTMRARPCGYWLAAEQSSAIQKLQALGVKVTRLETERLAHAESYRVLSEKGGQRQDARGAIAASKDIRNITVDLDKATVKLPAGSWYVGLNQPLGNLIAAALEPDSQNSYVANHVMDLGSSTFLRILSFVD